MKRSISFYKILSGLAFIIFISLVLSQVYWLKKAVYLQKLEHFQKLQRLVPNLALEINALGHEYFHGKSPSVDKLPLEEISNKVERFMRSQGISQEIPFAIFQDTTNGIFVTNNPTHKDSLQASNIRACISCIISFSISKESSKTNDESEGEYFERVSDNSEFQYFSPVNNLVKNNRKTIWLALYQPHSTSNAVHSLKYLFILSITLIILLLGLFYFLLNSLAKHKRMSQVKDDFFNNMTHEFKTPLSSIRLASKVLRMNKDPNKNIVYHDLIEKESKTLEFQIDKLLELSLVENEKLTLDHQETSLKNIINEIPRKLKPLIDSKACKLEISINFKNDLIIGDAYHLSNCFCNLIENSLKYGGPNNIISIIGKEENGIRTITIRDNGPGIPNEYGNKIFERFFRGQKSNSYKGQGFGIGLSYVQSIIKLHGGVIQLDKNYTEGTAFILTI